ncbi:MAG: hypothetical protein GC162_10865 [Planctomycetes bacterium]|nr:hypothetical protein [Planctomycetota bacterium]
MTTKTPKNPTNSPRLSFKLDPAQQRFFADESRVQVVCWHRQKGKDFTTAAKAVMHALRTGQPWYIISLTQRQADETFAKCVQWAKAFKAVIEATNERAFTEYDATLDEEFTFRARELMLPGGGKVVSLPGRNPDTLAGLTGNVIFTEFGLFPKGGYDHWRVVFPLATRGFHVIAISTPRGKDSKFFELVNDPDTYAVHFCDIYQSIAEGFVLRDQKGEPTTLDVFRKLYGDEAGWQREYECKFTGDLEALVKWSQLIAAGELGRSHPFDLLRVDGEAGWVEDYFKSRMPTTGRLEMGWDVARRGHLSSLWINHALPGKFKSLRFLVLMHGVSFELQRHIVKAAMSGPRVGVGCGDATGLGMDSNETLHDLYGDRWEPVDFGGKRKSDLGSTLATTFTDGGQAIPPIDGAHKFIATDLYAIQKEEEGGGASRRLKLYETPNPLMGESHCDIAWSAALALYGSSLIGVRPGLWVL